MPVIKKSFSNRMNCLKKENELISQGFHPVRKDTSEMNSGEYRITKADTLNRCFEIEWCP